MRQSELKVAVQRSELVIGNEAIVELEIETLE